MDAPDSRLVMISGASRGIGLAMARRLAAEGYTLSLGVRSPEEAAAAGGLAGDKVAYFAYDARDREAAARWVDGTVARFGRIDALVNNAGIWLPSDLGADSEDAISEMWEINAMAPLRVTRAALPHLRLSGRGRVINMASTDGKRYRDASVSLGYAMAKHALMVVGHATRFAAWDDGVRVTSLCPGGVDTEMVATIPGAVPAGNRLEPGTIGEIVSLLLKLPNTASVPEMIVNTRLESMI